MNSFMRILRSFLCILVFIVLSKTSFAAEYIIKDGKPNAEIIVAEVSPRMVSFAALELQYYLKKISGAKVPIVFEKTNSDNIKIYVGKSKYTDEMGIEDKDLNHGAYRIVSGADFLVLLGQDNDSKLNYLYVRWDKETEEYTDVKVETEKQKYHRIRRTKKSWWRVKKFDEFMGKRYGMENRKVWNPKNFDQMKEDYIPGFLRDDTGGSFNAVCAFLRSLGVEWYMPEDIGEYVPELKTIALPDVNKTDKPDFAVRTWHWYSYPMYHFNDLMWARRLGMNTTSEVLGGSYAHGLTGVHRYKDMQEKHPEYYALRKDGTRVTDYRGYGHVCFSSEGLYKATLKYARFMFDNYNLPHISLWPCDGFTHCRCEECKKLSASDLVWGFIDKVARELYKTHPDRLVSCGAYTPYIYPPSNVEKFTPNVLVSIVNVGRALFDDPVKWNDYTSRVEGFKKKVAKGRIMRVENNRYHKPESLTFPIIFTHNMAKDLQYLNGYCIGECNEMNLGPGGFLSPGCDHLNLYINARFLWDADQDIEKVLAEYYDKFYGPAAKEMKEFFNFAEAKYSRIDRSLRGGRTNVRNVAPADRVKVLELLHKARETAGDTVYGQRIDVIINELPDLNKVREEAKALQEKGNPRDNAVEIIATNLKAEEKPKVYKLLRKTSHKLHKPDVDTSFTIKWTEKSLTFNIRCNEPDMGSIKIGEKVWEGDSIVLLIESPYHSYYQIEISPDGRIFDADRWGSVVTRWKSMADVKFEKGKDHWKAKISIPIAVVGEDGAEGDPMNYVVAPRITADSEWYFNIARRRPRRGYKNSNHSTYTLSAGGVGGRNIFAPDCFARLIFE